jgi:hypothetical protein
MGCALSSTVDGVELRFSDIDILFSPTHGIEIKTAKLNELMANLSKYSKNSQQTILKAKQSFNNQQLTING